MEFKCSLWMMKELERLKSIGIIKDKFMEEQFMNEYSKKLKKNVLDKKNDPDNYSDSSLKKMRKKLQRNDQDILKRKEEGKPFDDLEEEAKELIIQAKQALADDNSDDDSDEEDLSFVSHERKTIKVKVRKFPR